MAEALARRGHEAHVATYPAGDDTTPIPYHIHRIARGNRQLDPRPGPSARKLLYLDPLLCKRVMSLLDKLSFDVIHAHHYEGLITSLCARQLTRRIPVIYDAHTLLASELPYYRLLMPRRLAAMAGRMLDRKLPRCADHIIAVTDRMRAWFTDDAGIPHARISLIPNGVEYEHFAVNEPVDAGPAAAPQVVFAGNMAEYQGIELLLQVFRRVRDAIHSARLLLITDSALGHRAAQIEKLGLTGSVSLADADYASLPSRLAAADVLANPRIDCDGIPQKLLNYMAAGRPIVSFAGSAGPLEHGKTALVVPDGNIDAFANAVLRLIHEPGLGASLGQAAQHKVNAEHGWQHVAEQVESIYGQLVRMDT